MSANNRLTWRDVAAPDFSGAARATALMGTQLGAATDSFSEGLTGLQDQRMQRESASAIDAAMRYGDANAWQAAMAQNGITGATGVNADMLTPEALTYLTGRRTELLGDQETEVGMASTQALTANTIQDTKNDATTEVRTNTDWERKIATEDRNAALERERLARETSAQDWIQKALATEDISSAEDLERLIANTGGSLKDMDARRTAAGLVGEGYFTVSDETNRAVGQLEVWGNVDQAVRQIDMGLQTIAGKNPTSAFVVSAMSEFSGSNIENETKAIDNITKLVAAYGGLSAEGTDVEQAPGQIKGIVDQATKYARANGIPPSLAYAAVQEAIGRDKTILFGTLGQGNFGITADDVKAILKPLTDPQFRKASVDVVSQVESITRQKTDLMAQLERERARLAFDFERHGGRNQGPIMENINSLVNKISKLEVSINGKAADPAVTPTPPAKTNTPGGPRELSGNNTRTIPGNGRNPPREVPIESVLPAEAQVNIAPQDLEWVSP